MSSYFFHGGDAFLAPPPSQYAEMTVERAMWQAFGKRVEEMGIEDFEIKTVLLAAEAEQQKKERERK